MLFILKKFSQKKRLKSLKNKKNKLLRKEKTLSKAHKLINLTKITIFPKKVYNRYHQIKNYLKNLISFQNLDSHQSQAWRYKYPRLTLGLFKAYNQYLFLKISHLETAYHKILSIWEVKFNLCKISIHLTKF
jgi:hypothetical protein